MDKQWKRGICLLAVLLVTVLSVIPARAAASGSLRITLTDRQGHPAGEVTIDLYRVAGTDGALTEDFSGADIPADSLLSEQDKSSNARTLADWASAHSLTGTEAVTDSRSKASFSSLDLGIYLAVCRSGQSVTFAPFLISIPMRENGWPLYDVAAYPKAERPSSPDGPDRPDNPDQPDTPDTPNVPVDSDTPENPDTPVSPEQPSLPQTGTDPFPVYALLTGGTLLTALGLADLLRQRKHSHDQTE